MKHWHCDIYSVDVYFLIGTKESALVTLGNKFKIDLTSDGSDGHCVALIDKPVIFIYVRDRKNIGAIAHECLHAASQILYRRGWKDDPNNNEPLTYLFETIFVKAIK